MDESSGTFRSEIQFRGEYYSREIKLRMELEIEEKSVVRFRCDYLIARHGLSRISIIIEDTFLPSYTTLY